MLGNNEHDARDAEFGRSLARSPAGGAVADVGRYPSYDWMGPELGEGSRDLQNYIRIILRHWLIIVTAVLVCLAGGLAKTLLSTPLYDATATIQIDREAAQVKNLDTWEPKEVGSADEFFQTQFALLKSWSLADATAKDPNLGLYQDPEVLKALGLTGPGKKPPTVEQAQLALTGFIQGNLTVSPVQRSRVVQLTVESASPQASARIANGVADNYGSQTLRRRVDSSAQGIAFLNNELATQKAHLELAQKQLADYARAQQIVTIPSAPAPGGAAGGGGGGLSASSAGANSTQEASSLMAMRSALDSATAARITAEMKWKTAQAMGASASDASTNPTIQLMKQDRQKLVAEYNQKLGIYKPEYDVMVKLKQSIDDADRNIAQEIQSLQTGQSNGLEKDYLAAKATEDGLLARVNGLTGQVLNARSKSVQFDILQREVDTSQQLYEALLQQYKEIGVSSHIGTNNISIVDRARVPGGPSKPQPMRNMLLAGFIGLGLGIGLAFLMEYLDESLRAPEDVEKKLGLPLLGSIPKLEKGADPGSALADVRSAFSEAYYSVRTALQFSTNEGVPSSLVVTSARPSEGKSTTATALAKNFARLGVRVVLIDADMRNPSLHRVFQAENDKGLSNYLTGGLKLHSLAQQTDTPNLFFIPCGPLPPNPAELLGGLKISEMLKEAREFFDLVIIDAPPVMGLADAPLLASVAGGTILVVEAGGTGRHLAKASVRRLNVGGTRLLGVLLTKFDARKSSYGYGYGYGYGYSYDYGSRPQIKGS